MGNFDGYKKIDSELTLVKIEKVGEHIDGKYVGIEKIKTPDGTADYMAIETLGVGTVAMAVNPSLARAIGKISVGNQVVVELAETVPSKGGKQDFKKYSVYVKEEELPL